MPPCAVGWGCSPGLGARGAGLGRVSDFGINSSGVKSLREAWSGLKGTFSHNAEMKAVPK